jgi:hypothetical protein
MGEIWTGKVMGDLYPNTENPFERIMKDCPNCNGTGLAPPPEKPLG